MVDRVDVYRFRVGRISDDVNSMSNEWSGEAFEDKSTSLKGLQREGL